MRFVSLLRPSPLLFPLTLSLSSTEGERARDSFNNPAARSEIYYFRATLLDKSIRLMLTLSLAPPLYPSLCLSPTPTTALSFSFFFFSSLSLLFSFFSFSLIRNRVRRPRTSVQGDLIKSVHLNLRGPLLVDRLSCDSSSCRGGGLANGTIDRGKSLNRERGSERIVVEKYSFFSYIIRFDSG